MAIGHNSKNQSLVHTNMHPFSHTIGFNHECSSSRCSPTNRSSVKKSYQLFRNIGSALNNIFRCLKKGIAQNGTNWQRKISTKKLRTLVFMRKNCQLWKRPFLRLVFTSHFGFPCQRTEKGASDRTVKRVVRPSRKRAFYHAILASFMHNFFFVFFRTKKGGKGASAW